MATPNHLNHINLRIYMYRLIQFAVEKKMQNSQAPTNGGRKSSNVARH